MIESVLSFRPGDSNHFAWQRAQPINRFNERKLNNKERENKYESVINFLNSKSVLLKKLLFACLCNVETATGCTLCALALGRFGPESKGTD